ncbi:sunset domain-containing protein [Ornithinimicrobium avium]|uniref:sunset domain-containing protein n=1 Tax=Ornithinimicrobium avium TaxID=2283195 RepID=UPI00192D6C38|nr:hypothetical protein [Ornithinimicrobium avium]
MNDTTKWIMIILLLLLIGAAVFMLLRSPGKENGAVDVPPADTDRDGIPDAPGGRAGVAPVDERGVYDQDAEAVPAEPVTTAGQTYDEPVADQAYDEPVADQAYDEPVADQTYDEPVADQTYDEPVGEDEAEPYRPEAGAYDTGTTAADGWDADGPDVAQAAAVGAAGAGGAAAAGPVADDEPPAQTPDEVTADSAPVGADHDGSLEAEGARPLTDEEIEAGSSEEPLDVEGQTQESLHEDSRGGWDPDGPDVGEAAALGAAAAAGGGLAAASAHHEPAIDEPVAEEQVIDEPVADADAEHAAPGAGTAPATGGFHQEILPTDQGTDVDAGPAQEYPVGDESTTYRADDGSAVRVEEPAAEDTSGLEEAAGRGAGYESVDTTPDAPLDTPAADSAAAAPAPADAGYGAPQTADDFAAGSTDPEVAAEAPTDGTYAAPANGAATPRTDDPGYAPVFAEAAYGAGSAEPLEDGTGPAGWEIKGNAGSMLFHTPESPSYDAVRAEVWFESEDAARNAGFAHWDRRRR